jgi:hypothetical protein
VGKAPSLPRRRTAEELWHLCLLKAPVIDVRGERAGRLVDVIVHTGRNGYPPVTGLIVQNSSGDRFVHVEDVADLDCGATRLSVPASAAQLLPLQPWHLRWREGAPAVDRGTFGTLKLS